MNRNFHRPASVLQKRGFLSPKIWLCYNESENKAVENFDEQDDGNDL
jgi:hypothetical protein